MWWVVGGVPDPSTPRQQESRVNEKNLLDHVSLHGKAGKGELIGLSLSR